MSDVALHGADALAAFRHEALLYAGAAAFLEGTVPFIEGGLAAGEPVLVVVGAEKIDRLHDALGPDAGRVRFADMAHVGHNPARIIPAWGEFLAANGGDGPVRGIGEPVYAERTPDELLECQRHEALLNVAFAGGPAWRLLCPYDTTSLKPDVIAAAHQSHRWVAYGKAEGHSADYRGDGWVGSGDDILPEPPGDPARLRFTGPPLESVRNFVREQVGPRLGPAELADLLTAVTEMASNSLVHGGGAGTIRAWPSAGGVICEVSDRGWIRQPLAGRLPPAPDGESGRGLWMVNQLCDLFQLRSSPAGTVARVHMQRR